MILFWEERTATPDPTHKLQRLKGKNRRKILYFILVYTNIFNFPIISPIFRYAIEGGTTSRDMVNIN